MIIFIKTEEVDFKWVYINGEKTMYIISSDGRLFNMNTNNEIKIPINKYTGYNGVNLVHNGKKYYKMAHRLVAETFIPNPENKRTVNHIDGNKNNNKVTNLEWATDRENVNDAWDRNCCNPKYGDKCNFTIYSDELIENVCSMLEDNVSISEIMEVTGISYHAIRDILFYGTRSNISSKYNINPDNYKPKIFSFDNDTSEKIKILFINNPDIKPRKICNILNLEYSNITRKAIYRIKDKM